MLKNATKYQPLIDYLAARTEVELVLTFAQIEDILDAPLAATAYISSEYWAGKRLPHVRRWQALGWRARIDRHDRHDLRVHFTRDTEE